MGEVLEDLPGDFLHLIRHHQNQNYPLRIFPCMAEHDGRDPSNRKGISR